MRHSLIPCVIPLLFTIFLLEAAPAHGGQPWFRKGKVRCLSYLNAGEQSVEFVPQVAQIGFNCALVMLANQPVDTIMPVIAAADREDLHLIAVDYLDNKKYLATPAGEKARRYVASDGRMVSAIPCPADPLYWQAVVGDRALELAQVRKAGHRALSGILFDIEDYGGAGELPCGGTYYCYCDECFGSFLRLLGKTDGRIEASHRQAWLTQQNLFEQYRKHQDTAVVGLFEEVRKRIDRIAPEFLLAVYPWPSSSEYADRQMRAPWDVRFAQGLGTETAPFLFLSEGTYIWGYDPSIERQQAELKEHAPHFLAVTGFNMIPAERLWWPEQMAASAYWASRRSDGYWIYVGDWPLLYGAAGQDVSGLFGDRPASWVKEFTHVNHVIASHRNRRMSLLPLPPLKDCLELSNLFDPKHAPDTEMYVRRWSELDLPWDGGEWVVLGGKPGDWFSFQRAVSRPDRYEISAWLTVGPDRPLARLYVDDKPAGNPVDLYCRLTLPGEASVLGYVDLAPGSHTFRLTAEDRNTKSTGYAIGLRALRIQRVGHPPAEMSIIGPFDNTGDGLPGYDTVYPPERGVDLEVSYPGKGGQPVRWRRVPVAADGYLDFMPLFSERKDCVAYGLVYVYCPSDGQRTVLLGSDDGGKLFVNGALVWGEAVARSAVRDQNAPRAQFHQGWNRVLLKVLQATGQWGAYLRVYDSEVKYSAIAEGESVAR